MGKTRIAIIDGWITLAENLQNPKTYKAIKKELIAVFALISFLLIIGILVSAVGLNGVFNALVNMPQTIAKVIVMIAKMVFS